MKTIEWCIGEELVSTQEDPSSGLQAGKFHNIMNYANFSQRTCKIFKGECDSKNFWLF